MSDKMAVNHIKALHILADCGVLNELNAQRLYDSMKAEIKQPASGYFYINDVYDFAENQVKELIP